MRHAAIEQVLNRVIGAKKELDDFTVLFALLCAAEALAKTIVLGMIAFVPDDKEKNRYRLEYDLVHADGVGDWHRVLSDLLTGPAGDNLLTAASHERRELIEKCMAGTWQYEAVRKLHTALKELAVPVDPMTQKTTMVQWFSLLALLRNKTRGHGAMLPEKAGCVIGHLEESILLIYQKYCLFDCQWAHLYRNISGKYRVSGITETCEEFQFLTREKAYGFENGVYIFKDKPRKVPLLYTDAELSDFFFVNGGLGPKKFEMLSYFSDDRRDGDSSAFHNTPGVLGESDTEGLAELDVRGKTFSNAPALSAEYVQRPRLEKDLFDLLKEDDRHPIITLLGRGGIGKTSLALKVIERLYNEDRYKMVVWLSARDVDLFPTGPKRVTPKVVTQADICKLCAQLTEASEEINRKDFNPKNYFEALLKKGVVGACLFVFDNFETIQDPAEMYKWLDTFVRLPNKILITTRLRDFKGDYPVEVCGMEVPEAEKLISQTSSKLNITSILDQVYIDRLTEESEGHPYVIKILLGEIADRGQKINFEKTIAKTDDILAALFERTYVSLSPCAQRVFLTLAKWNSAVPRLALEAVLFHSTNEKKEIEQGIESLLQYSMAESHVSSNDKQEFISLPLVASLFGRKKINVSLDRASIESDSEILQMLGCSRGKDVHLDLAKRIERFLKNISKRIESGETYDLFSNILETICNAYNPGWLALARWHMEDGVSKNYDLAKKELQRFLENDPPEDEAATAWWMLASIYKHIDKPLDEIHALIERSKLSVVPFWELSNTANKLNGVLKGLKDSGQQIEIEQRLDFSKSLLDAMEKRRSEAKPNDFSRMAWLAFHSDRYELACSFVRCGLERDPLNSHLQRLSETLSIRNT